MPELPEVETSCRGIAPWVINQEIQTVVVRDRRLRWPVPDDIDLKLSGQKIQSVRRRAKYILLDTTTGTAMLHLGMSGTVRIIDKDEPAGKHDHVDIRFKSGKALRFRDPRRFGSLLMTDNPSEHRLLRNLGPEPLSDAFDGDYLWLKSRGRKISIKQFIMNAATVVGVGNIYASEILFLCKINPFTKSGKLTLREYKKIIFYSKYVLNDAIRKGGSTIQNFVNTESGLGSFQNHFKVYGRCNLKCLVKKCNGIIKKKTISNRSTFYCNICQK